MGLIEETRGPISVKGHFGALKKKKQLLLFDPLSLPPPHLPPHPSLLTLPDQQARSMHHSWLAKRKRLFTENSRACCYFFPICNGQSSKERREFEPSLSSRKIFHAKICTGGVGYSMGLLLRRWGTASCHSRTHA